MIKLRLTVKEGQPVEFPITDGELLSAAVDRALENVPLGDMKKEDIFQALVNGHQVSHDLWNFVQLKKGDNVLIAPILKGDDSSSIFKQALLIVITVAASAILGPGGAAGTNLVGASLGLATAAVSIGAGLLLNALIPPPVPDTGALGGASDLATSQMYSINSQSNSTRKFGTVPKVYGHHKMFPIVAANPYTELEVDPVTKELVQYFYAIYDFGYGPLQIENIQIGDTPLTNFSDVNYTLYDTGKPLVSEGVWDDFTKGELQYYKGDVEVDSFSTVLEGNKEAGGPQETWEAIRNSAENIDGAKQAITLTFVNPSGLYSYSSNGTQGTRSIMLEIYFALVGTDNWIPFNDLTYVDEFLGVGGDQAYQDFPLTMFPPTYGSSPVYTLLYVSQERNPDLTLWPPFQVFSERPNQVRTYQWGYPKGATDFVVLDSGELVVGHDLRYQKQSLGKIVSITNYVPNSAYCTVKIDTPLVSPIGVIQYEAGYDQTQPTPVLRTRISWDSTVGFSTINRLLGKAKITRQETNPAYSSFRFTPKMQGQFKVRVTRISTTSPYSASVQDTLTWGQISTRFDRNPIVTNRRHLFLELKIRATNQLNGAIQNLSAIATSALDVYDTGTQTWSKELTSNPAWVFVDLLTGEVNKRAIAKSRLDVASIAEWAEFCDEVPDAPPGYTFTYPRFEANFILDFQTSLQGILNQVGAAAQASMNIIDGKYGVLIDKLKTVPVQVFTPRNSKDFQSNRAYSRRPDAVNIKFIDPSVGWQVAETPVYDNGFNYGNTIETDEMTSFACTNQEQAWRFGRYMMAQNRLRQETISITVDFEHLVCSRGDYVQITQDVMKVGGFPARVKSIAGNVVTTDDAFDLEIGPTYGFVFRGEDGSIVTNTLTVNSADTFELDGGDLPDVGDLIVVGVVGQIVYDCIVKSISPSDDLTATLVLVEKADAIYEAESTNEFPEYNPQISQTSDSNTAPPGEVQELEITENNWECDGSGYRYFIKLDWDVPITGSSFEYFQVFVNYGKGFTEAGTTRESNFDYTVDAARLGLVHEFKVLGVSATGKKLDLGAVGSVDDSPLAKTDSPGNVDSLSMDITGEVLQLSWPQVDECDVQEYLVRYTAATESATWEASIPLQRVGRETTSMSVQARTGTYLIKAVDFAGNESEIPAKAVTTIPNLFNLNVIESMTDFPDLDGVFDKTEDQGGGALVLRESISGTPDETEYYSEGFYYYASLLDLGDIYTVRLQSLIQAEGFTSEDLMSNWVTLDAVQALANSRHSDWDVETQYRATNSLNLMADWENLADLETIGGGDPDDFTEWRKFTIGDATGRIFQFRLRLLQFKPSVTPRVFDGTIKADMPDRREEYRNLVTTGGVYELEYSTPFKGPGTSPQVTVSVDDLGTDRFVISEKTLAGFKIEFFDETDNPVDKTFDVAIAGYGRQATSVI